MFWQNGGPGYLVRGQETSCCTSLGQLFHQSPSWHQRDPSRKRDWYALEAFPSSKMPSIISKYRSSSSDSISISICICLYAHLYTHLFYLYIYMHIFESFKGRIASLQGLISMTVNFIHSEYLTPQWGWIRGEPTHPVCNLTMFSVLGCPVKNPKLTGKEARSGKPLVQCFDNSPWKAGKFDCGGDNAQKASSGWAGGQRAPASLCGVQSWQWLSTVGCAHLTSGSSAPSTWSQAPREAHGKGQATITGLFFQLKPNPRVHFCHPASNHSVTVRN